MNFDVSQLPDDIFRAYDIRGIVDEGLNEQVITLIGQAIGSEALDQDITDLIVAADARLSSPAYSAALTNGILSTGCNVTDIGIAPTPLMYFATHNTDIRSGVMVTGSHNPKHYNGVKMVFKNACLTSNQIALLKTRIQHNTLHKGQGVLSTLDIKESYISYICQQVTLKNPIKIVVDCGNGAASCVAPDLFSALGTKVVPLFCELDGNFPNHHPDPTDKTNLIALIDKVLKEKADLGIAFDGDGDRVALITNAGRILDADKLMMSFIADILPENPGAKIIYDVKSSQLLEKLIKKQKGQAIMCKSGHSYVKQSMQETGALLGGEFSAHIFFKHRWFGFDDGLYVATRFLELMDKNNCCSQAIYESLPENVNTPELSIDVSEKEKFSIMQSLQKNMTFVNATINDLDGIRVNFAQGWGLIRASNTTPKLVLRFEAETQTALEEIINLFKQEILRIKPLLHITF